MANKENMRKWVAALRSGDFEQAVGFLEVKRTFVDTEVDDE